MASRSSALLICGLAREGKLAAGPDVAAVPSGGSRAALERRLADLDPARFGAVLSFGLAGALNPALRVGDVVVSRQVQSALEEESSLPPRTEAPAWWAALENRLATLGPRVVRGTVLGVDAPLASAAAKASSREASACVAVDMESHLAAAFAARHRLPFGILRVISDGAGHAIPPAAMAAMREDGGIDAAAVLRSLARDPGQIPALIRTARDGVRAFGVLGRVGGLLGLVLGLHL